MTQQAIAHTAATAASRASMLRACKAWQTTGQVNRALDLYTRIMERYPDSEEAREALAQMLTVAQEFERQGRFQLAIGIYERMEDLSP